MSGVVMEAAAGVTVPAEVSKTVETRVAWARGLVIRTVQERDAALAVVREVKGFCKAVEESFDRTVKSAHAAWKAAVAQRDGFLRGPQEVERLAKAAIIKFEQAQEAARIAEQRRLQAEADERARKEQEALLARAAKLKTPERAEALREQAALVQAPTVVVAPAAPKAEGAATVTTWKARVVDQQAFIRAAVEAGRWEFLVVDERALNDFARRTKGQVALTGIEFFAEQKLAVRI